MSYLRNAIAPGTRRTYSAGVASFRQWREEHRRASDELPTADDIGGWLADLADRGGHSVGTLRSYAAGVSSWYAEMAHPDNPALNPARSPAVIRLLKGIERARAERAQMQPLRDDEASDAQPLLWSTLRKFVFAIDKPRDRLFMSAAYLAVAAGLRPGELFGDSKQPERALRREQFAFFTDSASREPLHPPGYGATPQVLQLTLRVTKTSQMRRVIKYIAAPAALAAIWRWHCDTQDRGPLAHAFQLDPVGPPLSTFALVKDMERRHAAANLGPISYTGKSFRQGGASTLAALGHEGQDISTLGWALDSPMWNLYSRDPQVQRQRAIKRAGLMQPAVAAAAAEPTSAAPRR